MLIRMVEDGATADQIARRLHRTISGVRDRARKLEITLPGRLVVRSAPSSDQ